MMSQLCLIIDSRSNLNADAIVEDLNVPIIVRVNTKRSQWEFKNATYRTCREVRDSNPTLTSGMYWIDPDGQGVGDAPISVYCNMTTGMQ